MKPLLLLFTVLLPLVISAQRVPDNKDIQYRISDTSSPYFYPVLFERYMNGDTTLTLDDYYYLYYGYPYQDAYKPLEPITAEDRVLDIFARQSQPNIIESEEIIKYGKEVMKADPFSPRNLNFMTYAYGVLSDTLNGRINADRLAKVLATIESSGTGLKEDSPWHVLQFSHSVDVLAARNLDPLKRRVVTRTVEYISLMKPDGKVKGYYFDFGRVYWKRPETLPEKRVKGFEINGIKPKSMRNK